MTQECLTAAQRLSDLAEKYSHEPELAGLIQEGRDKVLNLLRKHERNSAEDLNNS